MLNIFRSIQRRVENKDLGVDGGIAANTFLQPIGYYKCVMQLASRTYNRERATFFSSAQSFPVVASFAAARAPVPLAGSFEPQHANALNEQGFVSRAAGR